MNERRNRIKYFANKIEDPDIFWDILEKYDSDKWEEVINYIWDIMNINLHKNHKDWIISKRSEELAKKIEKDLGICVFPIIFRTYAGKWLKAGGAFIWYMYTINLKEVGSCSEVSKFLKKSNRISTIDDWNDCELIYEPIKL
jgi:hypothetical protein